MKSGEKGENVSAGEGACLYLCGDVLQNAFKVGSQQQHQTQHIEIIPTYCGGMSDEEPQ